MQLSTHAGRLERWLDPQQLAAISQQMREWYGPPIPLLNVPGRVYATRGGDFVGPIKGGFCTSLTDLAVERLRRGLRKQLSQANAGFASLSDLIAEATSGKIQQLPFTKVGTVATNTSNESLWTSAGYPSPPASGTATTIPGGDALTRATAGALGQANPSGTDTLHLTTIISNANAAPNTLLMYDRLFQAGSLNLATAGSSQSVTGVPGRYNSTNSNATGNFAFLEITAAAGTTVTNISINYTDSAGGASENSGTTSSVASAVATRIPHANFFLPLASGKLGFNQVNSVLFSTASTGSANIVLGHIMAMIPQPAANQGVVIDGINSCFNLVRVYTDACLAFMEIKGVATATTYSGLITMVSG